MFNSNHYVPILKWKSCEKGALKALYPSHKKYITPLIQLVMPRPKKTKDWEESLEELIDRFKNELPKIAKELIETWGYRPIFIDVSLLFSTELKVKALKTIHRELLVLRGTFIPVIYLNDDDEIKETAFKIAKESQIGLCLRLICSDFSTISELNQNLSNLLRNGLNKENIDLLVDIKEIINDETKYTEYINLSQKIIELNKWRTFIFSSGSFPQDMSEYKVDKENLITRTDWNGWITKIKQKHLTRVPSFSDYTIQYPIYKPSMQFYHPTTSLKYTLENHWLIMKGEKKKYELYLAHAALLAKSKEFLGKDFSKGDEYIYDRAQYFPKYMKDKSDGGTGNTSNWLRAGINHHLSLVAHQISNLPS